jgi:putative two-component system response regulator
MTQATEDTGEGQARTRVLVVDDLEQNVELLRRYLTTRGYEVLGALGGQEAIDMARAERPDVVLLDLVMPEVDGYRVCEALRGEQTTAHMPIIIVTGQAQEDTNVRALQLGADDVLTKPIDTVLLEARIRASVQRARLYQENARQKRQLEAYASSLEEMVRQRTTQVLRTQQVTVFSLARLAESRDPETGEHLDRMRRYSRVLAETLAKRDEFKDVITEDYATQLYNSSPLHDIGKVGIPDEILLKPGKLSDEEFDIMKTHTLIGGRTLEEADDQTGEDSFLKMGRDIAYYHHEKWGGNGYPEGRSGRDIPLCARIVALGDIYDALTSKRPYKEPFTHEKSRGIILEGRGGHLDPQVVDAFIEAEDEFVRIREEHRDSGRSRIYEIIESLRQPPVSEAAG